MSIRFISKDDIDRQKRMSQIHAQYANINDDSRHNAGTAGVKISYQSTRSYNSGAFSSDGQYIEGHWPRRQKGGKEDRIERKR